MNKKWIRCEFRVVPQMKNFLNFSIQSELTFPGGLGMKQADVHAVSAVGTYKAEVLQCSLLASDMPKGAHEFPYPSLSSS